LPRCRSCFGVVALPISPRYPALQTSLSGDGNRALRVFAKTGLVIRPGTTFELIVPARFTNRLSIGWGLPGTPGRRVVVNSCSSPGGGWLAYVGGHWIDHPACAPVIVRAGSSRCTSASERRALVNDRCEDRVRASHDTPCLEFLGDRLEAVEVGLSDLAQRGTFVPWPSLLAQW